MKLKVLREATKTMMSVYMFVENKGKGFLKGSGREERRGRENSTLSVAFSLISLGMDFLHLPKMVEGRRYKNLSIWYVL